MKITDLKVTPLSMIDHNGLQRVDLSCKSEASGHFLLNVYKGEEQLVQGVPFAILSGTAEATVMLPKAVEDMEVCWQITDTQGNVLCQTQSLWKKPRELSFYVITSAHTDIGLHNPQYIQRHNSVRFTDKAMALCDATADRPAEYQYRYVMEGTWFFENYIQDKSPEEAENLIENYIKKGKIGVCGGIAGNHTQMYGLEELCVSAYERSRLQKTYGICAKTVAMVDMNGITPSLIAPYADAGYENIVFAPNQWNPNPSTLWKSNKSHDCYTWNTANPAMQGGGSRIDIRYDSNMPMLFYWKDIHSDKKLLVWGSTAYGSGGSLWGIYPSLSANADRLQIIAATVGKNLPVFEENIPYDIWMFASYDDDMEPNLNLADAFMLWGEKWQWPKFSLTGNPDQVFDRVREEYGDQIPVLSGDITGGWYQHPISAPELVAKKFEIDRSLATAEKLSTLACMAQEACRYPKTDFDRAWKYLLWHDEHSYGTSNYEGKQVFETWMQHNDWLNQAKAIADMHTKRAAASLADQISTKADSIVVFNPASVLRQEYVTDETGAYAPAAIPPMGYCTVDRQLFKPFAFQVDTPDAPPVVENAYYRLTFSPSGGICSVFDKQLGRELLSGTANEPLYTKDCNQTFAAPENAVFEVKTAADRIVVTAVNRNSIAGADIVRTVTLDSNNKRIDIENRLEHAREFYNNCRYNRYLYFAFPFDVPNAKRYCHLNGSIAEYGVDVTGHATDVYMAANEWCCAENKDFGVALILPDSTLIEFDHIHPDKTDYGAAGDSSAIYNYVATDWLQKHGYGGDYFSFRFRYSIVSYAGGYEAAGVPKVAECCCTPVVTAAVSGHEGVLAEGCGSLFLPGSQMRLVSLKRASNGDGIVARLYGKQDAPAFADCFGNALQAQLLRTDESRDYDFAVPERGFYTYRLGAGSVHLHTCEPETADAWEIGSVHTGLITAPMAARGEHSGHLYLLWGQSGWEELSHYCLYRGETPDFACNEASLIANVDPGEYRVVSYEDRGLKEYFSYYYRVCAVSRSGETGPMSDVFCGITREVIAP